MSAGIEVKEFKYIPGVNDAEYIKKLEELCEIDKGIINTAVAKIKKLSAQLAEQPTIEERKAGRWIRRPYDGIYCTACGKGWSFMLGAPGDIENYHYCPNCGANMREVTE